MLEGEVQQHVQIEARKFDSHLLRNNSGALEDKTGRLVRYGLGNVSKAHTDKIASSDLIGFTVRTITPDMIGKKVAIFTAIEVKRSDFKMTTTGNKDSDNRLKAQIAFINWVYNHGGISGIVNSLESLRKILSP